MCVCALRNEVISKTKVVIMLNHFRFTVIKWKKNIYNEEEWKRIIKCWEIYK